MAQSNRETMGAMDLLRRHSRMLPDGTLNPHYVGPPEMCPTGHIASSCPGCGAPVQGSGCDYCGRGRIAWPTPPDALDIRGDG